MSVDNSEKILSMMSFGKDDFYFVQVLKRRKDNPEMERDMVVLNNYYIDSAADFNKKIGSIKALCNVENARAYFRINKRNYKDLSLKINKRVVEYIATGDFKALRSVFDKIAGETHSDPNKKWLVDIDWKDFDSKVEYLMIDGHIAALKGESDLAKLVSLVSGLQIAAGREPMTDVIPSKNGFHLATNPFNLKKFKEVFPSVDVHKDNMVILYCQ